MSFFPYIGKVFTLPSDLSLIFVEDTILIDFVAFTFSEVVIYEPFRNEILIVFGASNHVLWLVLKSGKTTFLIWP